MYVSDTVNNPPISPWVILFILLTACAITFLILAILNKKRPRRTITAMTPDGTDAIQVSLEQLMKNLLGPSLYSFLSIKAWSYIDGRLIVRIFWKDSLLVISPICDTEGITGFMIEVPDLNLSENISFSYILDDDKHEKRIFKTTETAQHYVAYAKYPPYGGFTTEQQHVITERTTKLISRFIDIM